MFNALISHLKSIKIELYFLGVLILLIAITPDTGPGGFDRTICWTTWSNYIFSNGLGNIYTLKGVNYLPLYPYILWAYGQVQGNVENLIKNIHMLKYITLAFEVLAVYYLYLLLKTKYNSNNKAFLASLFVMFNFAYLYDSTIYGQVDGIFTAFVFISFYYSLQQKVSLSILCLVIAINFKLQAVIFGPFIALILFPVVYKKISFGNVIKWVIPAIICQLLILLPYILSNNFLLLISVIKSSLGQYPWVSMGAYNMWYLFFDEPSKIHDKSGFFGRSYNRYGMFLFFTTLFVILRPHLKTVLAILKRKYHETSVSNEKLILTAAIIPIIFFFFNTQMHSRYMHPAILLTGTYALYTKRYTAYAILSVAYLLNLENEIKILKGNIAPYKYFFFEPKLLASMYAIVLVLLFYDLFSKKTLDSETLS